MRQSIKRRADSGAIGMVFLSIAIIAVALSSVYLGWYELDGGVLERVAPKISIVDSSKISGVGLQPFEVTVEVSDQGMGLDELIVRTEQHRERADLIRHEFDGEKETTFTFKLGGPDIPYDEGELGLEIRVWDKSFWSNSDETRITLEVDKKTPKLSVLTSQHNGQEGGTQLVFYKAKDAHLDRSGARVGNRKYLGVRGEILDPTMRGEDCFGAFYAIPANKNIQEKTIKLFAEDRVGNLAEASFYNKVSRRKYRSVEIKVPTEFGQGELGKLLEPFKLEKQELGSSDPFKLTQLLINDIRIEEDKRIRSAIKQAGFGKRVFTGALLNPGGVPYYRFGERVTYFMSGESVGTIESSGFRLDVPAGTDVFPSLDGTVIFSENLAFYGKTIVIDHGAGISTVYAGLQSILAGRGEKVLSERPIGTSGLSGLFFRPGIFFEVRVQGEPVTPLEWWDAAWVKNHILDKIKETKRLLGVGQPNPLE